VKLNTLGYQERASLRRGGQATQRFKCRVGDKAQQSKKVRAARSKGGNWEELELSLGHILAKKKGGVGIGEYDERGLKKKESRSKGGGKKVAKSMSGGG